VGLVVGRLFRRPLPPRPGPFVVTRDADAIRTRIVATVAELQLADAQRDHLLAEIRALDAQPSEPDVPGSRPWLQRMLGT
jgi:hypothetical protein